MNLTLKYELILETIIKEHIGTGIPVSSNILVEKYKLNISPATVRNEMAALEKDELGYTPLDWACTRGHWVIVRHLLDAGAPINSIGGDGGTAMHKACHHGRADMIKLLLDAGGDLSVANQWGRVPLHVSVRRGHGEVVALLLECGADINATTREGWTPRHVAYKAG